MKPLETQSSSVESPVLGDQEPGVCGERASWGPASGAILPLTILVPAYNEERHLAQTLQSLMSQTRPPEKIIVIDDCSTDATGDVARRAEVAVVRPPENTGSKALAQNAALDQVETPYAMTVDADTVLAPDALEKIFAVFKGDQDEKIAAACGFVVPRHVRTIWERGRYIEYLFSLTLHKRVQDFYEKPVVGSGCFCVYRTNLLKQIGGWSNRTVAEDMDLTWGFYGLGKVVRFVPDAVCYPVEPDTLSMLHTQLRRWTHGFAQNVKLHRGLWPRVPILRGLIATGVIDTMLAFLFLFVIAPVMAVVHSPWWLMVYVVDLPIVTVPALAAGIKRREVGRVLLSLPCYVPLRLVNAWCSFEAIVSEWVLNRPLTTFVKGHT